MPETHAKTAAVEVHDLCSAFDDFVVHEHLDLRVPYGVVMGIVGGSGTGKSVLLETMLGLRKPQAGSVKLLGAPGEIAMRSREIDRRIGVMFQNGALFSDLTVQENVEAPLLEHTRIRGAMLSKLATMKISLAGLDPAVACRKPGELSGGMRKRASLARALALDPELLFLDEPTSGLDPISAGEFDDLIVTLSKALRLTVVMITHDLDSLYATCDLVAVLADKKVVAVAPPAELERSDHPWIRQYFCGDRAQRKIKRDR